MAIGNTKIDNLLKRVKLLNETVAWLKSFDGTTKSQIIEWIQKDQLTQKGVDKYGNVIGYYSLLTQSISNGKKKFNTHYTLFDTGDFYRSMAILVFQESILIDGDTKKMEDRKWYSNAILGLTDENFTKLKEIVQASYIDYARATLQIN